MSLNEFILPNARLGRSTKVVKKNDTVVFSVIQADGKKIFHWSIKVSNAYHQKNEE